MTGASSSRRSSEPPSESAPRGGFFLNVVPAILYVLAIFYAGSAPNPELPETAFVPADKLLHFLGFAGMQIAMLRAVRYELPRLRFARQLVLAAVCSSAVGAALELYQAFLPYRSAELLDLIADAAGAFSTALVLWLAFGRRYDEPP